MGKKDLSNLDYADKLKGGGAANILGERKVEPSGAVEVKESKIKNEESKKDWKPQTFNVNNDDYEFFQKYSLYMGFKSGKKYSLIRCFNDAMALLRAKYPDIEP